MSSDVRIFINPSCSKCRLSMQLLDDNGVSPEVIEYLNQPPSSKELNEILDLLKLEPRQLMRQHEAPYTELELHRDNLSHEELIQAMIDNPILIERPIVIKGNKATIGRPPEKILDIL
jgi:arsenate reductase